MGAAFVLGNGISRRGLPLHDLRTHGPVYGCNALYRDFTPDVLVATDRPIALHIESTGYPIKNRFYTRRPTEGQGAYPVPKQYFGYSSGPIAVGLAALDGHHRVYLLGFDMGPSENQTFNNLYADTEFYKASSAVPTYTGNWVKQILQICRDFESTSFLRVHGATTAKIPEFDRIKNLKSLSMVHFLDRLNKLKDF